MTTGPRQILAVIPARGGSKRIPGKNVAACHGLPLVAWTCRAGRESRTVTRLVLSTEDEAIARVGREHGAEVPFLRAPHLSADDTPMLPVLQDLLLRLNLELEAVVLLQPTSPLRTALHIDQAVELFRSKGPDSVVSVVPVPHIFHPLKLVRPMPTGLVPYHDDRESVVGHRALPPVYAKNGPAVLVTRPDVIQAGSLYGNVVFPYEMPFEASVDVDEPFDLALAEFLLQRRESRS